MRYLPFICIYRSFSMTAFIQSTIDDVRVNTLTDGYFNKLHDTPDNLATPISTPTFDTTPLPAGSTQSPPAGYCTHNRCASGSSTTRMCNDSTHWYTGTLKPIAKCLTFSIAVASGRYSSGQSFAGDRRPLACVRRNSTQSVG